MRTNVAGDQVGRSVAGDVNGDGIDDIVIGASLRNSGAALSGSAFVVFGRTTAFASPLDLTALTGADGFHIDSSVSFAVVGGAVAGAGDVNGDGIADVIVNAAGENAAYVVFGKTTGFAASVDTATIDGTNGFRLAGFEAAGVANIVTAQPSVRGAGDVNGDNAGAAWVVFGRAAGFAANVDVRDLDGVDGFRLDGLNAGDVAGASVSGAGDVNGDGFDDILVGASSANQPGFANTVGSAFLVYGHGGGFAPVLTLGALDATQGINLHGVTLSDLVGQSVSAAGDVNGDCYGDILVGAPNADLNTFTNNGRTFVVFGGPQFGLPTQGVGYTVDGGTGNDVVDYEAIENGILADLLAGTVDKGVAGFDRVSDFETIIASGGDDRIVGDNLANRLIGAGGDDQISGGGGNDVLETGDGDDTAFGGSGNDSLSGEFGDDALYGGSGNDVFTDLVGSDAMYGGDGDDFVLGNVGDDVLRGGGGNDIMLGGGDSDSIHGDDGNDSLLGEAGSDALYGGTGNDKLDPGLGSDALFGGDGNDVVDYSSSPVAVIVNLSIHQAVVGGEVDTLDGIESILGSGANDILTGDGGANFIDAEEGDDFIDAGGGNDWLVGNLGFDMLFGGEGNDVLTDAVTVGTFNQLFGGNGIDTVDYFNTAGDIFATLAGQFGMVNGVVKDTYNGIENLIGASGNDLLEGDGNVNTLNGAAGFDLLFGGGADDILIGGTTPGGTFNQLFGGAGNDTADYSAETANVSSSVAQFFAIVGGVLRDQFSSIENLVGGSGSDELQGDGLANVLTGGAGNDVLLGQDGDDVLFGGTVGVGGTNQLLGGNGFDSVSYAAETTAVFADLASFFANVNGTLRDLYNSMENVTGGSAGDQLFGDGGVNVVSGGAGGDVIQGRGGADTLTGGAGADAFNHDIGEGSDIVTDFSRADGDKVDLLSGIVFTGTAGGGNIANLSDGTTITMTVGFTWIGSDFI